MCGKPAGSLEPSFAVLLRRGSDDFGLHVLHCSQLDPASELSSSEVVTVDFTEATVPVVSCASHQIHRIRVPMKKSVETAAVWQEEILPRLLSLCQEALLSATVSRVQFVWDGDREVAVAAVLAVLVAFSNPHLIVYASPGVADGPISKDTVKRMHAVLQQHVPTLPALSRRYMKHLNAFFSHPVSGWVAWARKAAT